MVACAHVKIFLNLKKGLVVKKFLLVQLFLNLSFVLEANINFANRNTAFIVEPSATFYIAQPIASFDGTLIKLPTGSISGQPVTFNYGVFEDPYNSLFMSGIYDPAVAGVSFSGNGFLNASNGDVLETLTISGVDNLVEGQPTFNNVITLQDAATTVTFALQSRINQNINMNNATLYLKEDLKFTDEKMLTGSGTINAAQHKIEMGGLKDFMVTGSFTYSDVGDIVLNGRTIWTSQQTFKNDSNLNGNGNVLELASGGKFFLKSGSTLHLTDVIVRGVVDGSFIFEDGTPIIYLSNVDLQFSGNTTFTQGGLYVEGPSTWEIADYTVLFDTSASLTVDGVTLWKDHIDTNTYAGDIAFGAPFEAYYTSVNSGTIQTLAVQDLWNYATMLDTSTQNLQIQVDAIATDTGLLSTSTISLQNQLDQVMTDTTNLQSQLDQVMTDTTNLQGWIDLLDTSTQNLQIQADAIATDTGLLSTSTISLQNQLDQVMTDTTDLRQWIDWLDTSTQNLQIQADAIATDTGLLSTSTISLQDQIDLLDTSTQNMQAEIDLLDTSTQNMQIQIDAIATDTGLLSTSTISLQDQIDLLDTSTQNM
ncbi:MAG: hypothetical protein UR26_C0006G0001, partial [candidate division TM6 bacterium GW2011_GWF2_32_72]